MRLLRLMDANLNRASEGIRVLEDTARMLFDDEELTLELKDMRHALTMAVKAVPGLDDELLCARDAGSDVLRSGETGSESSRVDIKNIVRANSARAQEALRVLEEFSKLIVPGLSESFKDIRFRLYESEKTVILKVIQEE